VPSLGERSRGASWFVGTLLGRVGRPDAVTRRRGRGVRSLIGRLRLLPERLGFFVAGASPAAVSPDGAPERVGAPAGGSVFSRPDSSACVCQRKICLNLQVSFGFAAFPRVVCRQRLGDLQVRLLQSNWSKSASCSRLSVVRRARLDPVSRFPAPPAAPKEPEFQRPPTVAAPAPPRVGREAMWQRWQPEVPLVDPSWTANPAIPCDISQAHGEGSEPPSQSAELNTTLRRCAPRSDRRCRSEGASQPT